MQGWLSFEPKAQADSFRLMATIVLIERLLGRSRSNEKQHDALNHILTHRKFADILRCIDDRRERHPMNTHILGNRHTRLPDLIG